MPFLGDVKSACDNSYVNGDDIMYSFPPANNLRSLADHDRSSQRNDNDTVTKPHSIALSEDDDQPIQNMNFTLVSTLRATGATTTNDNFSSPTSTEHFMDVRLSQDNGNVTIALSKVRLLEWSLCVEVLINLFQVLFGLTSKASTNSTRQTQDDEEINQFYFYEVSQIILQINVIKLRINNWLS